MKNPVSGVTFYKGHRIVFDGTRFTVIDDGTGRVVATDIYTMRAAKELADTIYCAAGA